MNKYSAILIATVITTFLLGLAGFLGYAVGSSSARDELNVQSHSTELQRNELSKAHTKLETVCAEYQGLYREYDSLYGQFGATSGRPSYVKPDSAKGEVEPCYGE